MKPIIANHFTTFFPITNYCVRCNLTVIFQRSWEISILEFTPQHSSQSSGSSPSKPRRWRRRYSPPLVRSSADLRPRRSQSISGLPESWTCTEWRFIPSLARTDLNTHSVSLRQVWFHDL